MSTELDEETVSYQIPARTITGSPSQILEEIDDMMDALRTVREAVVQRTPKPACPTNGVGWRARLARVFRPGSRLSQ